MRLRVLALFFSCLSVFPFAHAVGAEDCDKASSSADVMRCVNQNLEQAQDKLNIVYKTLGAKKTIEELEEAEELQNLWIEYRDQECDAEIESIENETLRRLEGLKCIARLTKERVTALQKTIANQSGTAALGEVSPGQNPRWINALSEDYQDVYWHYGGSVNGDLDCDDVDEYAMSGILYNADIDAYENVVAISENPQTGKPRNVLITLSALPQEDGEVAAKCSNLAKFSFEDVPELAEESVIDEEAEEAEEEADVVAEEEALACSQKLVVTRQKSSADGGCVPITIIWDGESFVRAD